MNRIQSPLLASAAALLLAACGGAEAGERPAAPARAAAAPQPAASHSLPAAPSAAAPAGPAASARTARAAPPSAAPAPQTADSTSVLRPGRPNDTRPWIPEKERELSVGQTAAAAAPSAADAAAVLRRAEGAYDKVRSLEADFIQDVTVPLLDQTQHSTGKIYHRRPNHFLMKFAQPAGDVVVADGRAVWMYYPSTDRKQVLKSSLAEGGRQVDLQQEFLNDATQRYTATLAGEEPVGGRLAHVLVLTPKGASQYRRIKVWVDQVDYLARRFEVTEENESVRRLELRNLKPNVTLSDQLFRFTPPAGTQVFEQ